MTIRELETTYPAFDNLAVLEDNPTPIKMTRHYKGIPLTQYVNIFSVCEDYIVFRSCDRQAITTPDIQHAHLHHPELAWPIRATIQNTILETGTFVMTDFAYQESDWVERSAERVQPKLPTYVLAHANHKRMIVTLSDINSKGIALWIREKYAKTANLMVGSGLHIDFKLPPAYHWEKLKGLVANIDRFAGSLLRVGVELQPNLDQARQLNSYLSQRKAEIMSELDRAYFRVLEPRHVEDLYF